MQLSGSVARTRWRKPLASPLRLSSDGASRADFRPCGNTSYLRSWNGGKPPKTALRRFYGMLADSTMEKETPTFAGVRVYILGGTDVTYQWGNKIRSRIIGVLSVSVNVSLPLGISGRGNNAQISLKSRPGQRDSRRAAHREEARTATGNRQKSLTAGWLRRSYLRDCVGVFRLHHAEFTKGHRGLYTQCIYIEDYSTY
jgi:hypothetical protein